MTEWYCNDCDYEPPFIGACKLIIPECAAEPTRCPIFGDSIQCKWKELFNGYVGKGSRTGKQDINGTEIYDGDILTYPKHHKPYCVSWCDDQAGFVCEHETNFMLACVWCEMKVVGNMRCNPELMGYKQCTK